MKRKLLVLTAAAVALFGQLAPVTLNKTVATAGTAVRLSSSNLLVVSATIQALHTNTGRVCFGDSSVKVSTNTGTCLSADQAGPLYSVSRPGGTPFDLSAFWLDSAVNGEGVSVTYYVSP